MKKGLLMDFVDFGSPCLSAALLPRTKKAVTSDVMLLAGGGGPHSGVPNGVVRVHEVCARDSVRVCASLLRAGLL